MRWLRYILKSLVFLLVLAVLLLAGTYAYLRSESGLNSIAYEISQRASSDGVRIDLAALRGDLLRDLTLGTLRVADREGVWLELSGVHVVWSPRALLRKQAPLAVLEAEKVMLWRMPLPAASAVPATKSTPVALRDYALYLPRLLHIGELRVDPAVAGTEQRVRIHGEGNAQRYALKMETLQGIPVTLDAVVQPQQEDFSAKIDFKEAEGGVVAAMAGLPNNISLALNADIAANCQGDVTIHTATVHVGSLHAQAQGYYAVSRHEVDLSLQLDAPDMQVAQALSEMPISGSATLQLTAKGTPDALAVVLAAQTPHLVVQGSQLRDVSLTSNGTLNPSAWQTDAFVAAGMLQLKAVYNDTPVALTLEGKTEKNTVLLPSLSAQYGVYRAQGAVQAKGSLAQFGLESNLAVELPEGSGTVMLKGDVDTERQQYQGDINGHAIHKALRFDFAATGAADAARATLSKLSLKGPGVEVKGNADIAIAEQLADADLTIRASDLGPLGKVLGKSLSGALDADVRLAHSSGRQRAEVNAHAQKLALAGMAVENASVAVKARDAKALEGLNITLDAAGIAAGTLQVARLQSAAAGGMKNGLSLNANGEGSADGKPWKLSLAGKVQQPTPDRYRLDLTALDGMYADAPVRLASPATMDYSSSRSSLSATTLEVAGGRVVAEGTLEGAAVSGKATISGLALHRLPGLDLPEGTLNATLDLSGTGRAPIVRWSANSALIMDGNTVDADARGEWKAAELQADVAVKSREAKANAHVAIPATLSLQPFATSLTERSALRGTLSASLPLSMFNAQLRPQGHRLGGLFAGNATLAGTLGAPYFDGAFALTDGRYDHSTTGICLRDLNAQITGNSQAVRLVRLSATDSNKKQLTASADFTLAGTPTLAGKASFDHFRLFCGGMMNGEMDGDLAINGTMRAASIAGKLVLGPLNIQIPGARATSDIPQVPIEWIKPGQARESAAKPSVVALDITLSAPQQLFIRGRGLDAEFAGLLSVTGSVNAPQIKGQFEKRRGTFVLLDRVMQLDTATVRFDGPIPPSPFLDVKASTKVNSNTITVSLAGPAALPKLSLSSTPSLPQDELLALLLFGRKLESISAFEALQLAQATRTLAGLDGGGPGVVDTIRNSLGLDRLQVGADADNNLNVTTGKYVTDDVYVGVVQGAKPEDREIVTEITLTPSVQGKTSVDSVGNQSVGMEWKRDY